MSAVQQCRRYLLFLVLGIVFSAIAVAGIVTLPLAAARHMDGLVKVTAVILLIALVGTLFMFAAAYVPPEERRLPAMLQAMEAGEAVTGRFATGLRDLVPGRLPSRWRNGWIVITPRSVSWEPRLAGRTRDLTGAQCTAERRYDLDTDLTLDLPPSYYNPSYYNENVRVATLHAGGADVELAATAKLLEITRYSLARTAPGTP